jgi:erythritol transport system ATP-binding protein
LKRSGVTIIYISHRLNELLHLGEQFTVLRSGRVVGEAPRDQVSRGWIVERMSGRPAIQSEMPRQATEPGVPILEVRRLSLAASAADEAAQAPLSDICFTLRRGEILGVYGLLGAGRTELLESIAGSRDGVAGDVWLNGASVMIPGVDNAVKAGIALVPEDRQRDGLIPEMSIRENVSLAAERGLFIDRRRENARVKELAAELNIVAGNLDLPVTTLSGGNQQKVLIARCLMRSPSLLLLDEPTRGVDVSAKAEIYAILRKLANEGLGILFTSSEIEETKALADRALVLCQGRISANFSRVEITDQALFAAASPAVHSSSQPSHGVTFA